MKAETKFALAMMIFGSIGYFSLKSGLPSIELVFVRCLCASVLLGSVWLIGRRKEERQEAVEGREYLYALLCGFFLVVNWVFFFRSIELMSVTVAISIYHLAPVLVLVFGAILFKEKMKLTTVLAVMLCFFGTLLVGGINHYASWTDIISTGVLWAFGAALFYALTTMSGKAITKLNPVLTTVIQTMLGVVMLLPLVNWSHFSQLSVENWFYILVTGFVHTGFVYYLFFSSLRDLKAGTIAILVFLDPAVAIVMDVVLTGYSPDFYQIVGIVLIFTSVGYSFRKSATEASTVG